MKVGIEKPMAMAALLAAAAFTAHAEVWYVPGWNRTAERDGLAYTSCTNVFKGNVSNAWKGKLH